MPLLKMTGKLEPPLIKMSIDTVDHLTIAKKCYALAPKHYNWFRHEIDKLLKAGVI